MRKFLYTCFLLTVLLIINGCSNPSNKVTLNSTEKTDKVFIDVSKNIEQIKMFTSFPRTQVIISEDKVKIQEIVNYINSLDLEITEDKGGYLDGTYVIIIYFDDGTTKEFAVYGGRYFEHGKYRYKLTKEQGQKFQDYYYSFIKSESEIREIAYNAIAENEVGVPEWETVKNAKIEEYKAQKDNFVANSDGNINIIGKDTYRVTFHSGNPSKLGIITVYIDKNSFEFLGVDIRE